MEWSRDRFILFPNCWADSVIYNLTFKNMQKMYFNIDIGFDMVGPSILNSNGFLEGGRIRKVSPSSSPSSAVVSFPDDVRLNTAVIEYKDGEKKDIRFEAVSTLATIYQKQNSDGTLVALDAGGISYVIEVNEGDVWKQVIHSLVRTLVFKFGHQGQFAVNIYVHDSLPVAIPLNKQLTAEQSDDLQNDNQYYIDAHQAQRSLTLHRFQIKDDSQIFVDEYTYIWRVNTLTE